MRLVHRSQPSTGSLEEGDCYDHSYGEHVSDHVDVVRLDPAEVSTPIAVDFEPMHHVTTALLKRQFEERLAGRRRRRRH